MNDYAYVGNNPVVYIDAFGLLTLEGGVTYEHCIDDGGLSPLDALQLGLDGAGFIPGLGAIPDLLNAGISAARGNWTDAGLSALAAVPGIGDAAAAAKLANRAAKATGKAVGKNAAKQGDNVINMGQYKWRKAKDARNNQYYMEGTYNQTITNSTGGNSYRVNSVDNNGGSYYYNNRGGSNQGRSSQGEHYTPKQEKKPSNNANSSNSNKKDAFRAEQDYMALQNKVIHINFKK
jgi:hypothetical protein